MIYCFDLDNTLCKTKGNDYEHAKPIWKHIKMVNKLYEQGNRIIIWTGRGSVSGIDWEEYTKTQLRKWGLKFQQLLMGKPTYNFFVDDKAHNTKDFFK